MAQRIRIRLKSFDYKILDQSVERIVSTAERSGARVVKAQVPLSEMFGYVGDLRSKTQGRANYSMVFDSYAEVPANVSKEIIAKATGE